MTSAVSSPAESDGGRICARAISVGGGVTESIVIPGGAKTQRALRHHRRRRGSASNTVCGSGAGADDDCGSGGGSDEHAGVAEEATSFAASTRATATASTATGGTDDGRERTTGAGSRLRQDLRPAEATTFAPWCVCGRRNGERVTAGATACICEMTGRCGAERVFRPRASWGSREILRALVVGELAGRCVEVCGVGERGPADRSTSSHERPRVDHASLNAASSSSTDILMSPAGRRTSRARTAILRQERMTGYGVHERAPVRWASPSRDGCTPRASCVAFSGASRFRPPVAPDREEIGHGHGHVYEKRVVHPHGELPHGLTASRLGASTGRRMNSGCVLRGEEIRRPGSRGRRSCASSNHHPGGNGDQGS